MFCFAVSWSVEIAAKIKPGQRLDHHLLDGVVLLLNLSEYLRVKRRLIRHGREPRRNQDLISKEHPALFPCFQVGELR